MKINWMVLALTAAIVMPAFADGGHGMSTGGGMLSGSGMMVVADDASGMRPLGGLMNRGVLLCVREEDAERADEVLGEGEPGGDE